MTYFRSIKRFAALTAVVAITLQALWPLIAQARPAERTLTVALCSADGAGHSIEIPLGGKATGEEHCKLCVLGDAKAFATRDLDLSAFLLTGNAFSAPATPRTLLFPDPQLLSAQPRAPPANA